MLYVERDEQGKIVAICRQPGDRAVEAKELLDPEVLEFLCSSGEKDALSRLLSLSDNSIIRVLEDLIDLLVRKKVILFTELPEEAQKKIQDRKQLRRRMSRDPLMVDDIL
ncbi:hypothetical protein [Desulfolithobacter sp.]